MEKIYLSRRNLLSLLSKLDRKKQGDTTECTLIKNDHTHPDFPQTMMSVMVTAVEDDVYYKHREAGPVNFKDDPTKIEEKYVIVFKDNGGYYSRKGFDTRLISEAEKYDTMADAIVASEHLEDHYILKVYV